MRKSGLGTCFLLFALLCALPVFIIMLYVLAGIQ